ncbi:hypothetical protein SLS58_005153 [Diplodia intermedia]|uniref:Ankyrin repeat protein n=1 Tax=Diplodia intermedia TaxID=856260 RepID=A0ABR3TS49_9PEZI
MAPTRVSNLTNDPDIDLAEDRIGGVLHRALRQPDCTDDFITWLLERGANPNASSYE